MERASPASMSRKARYSRGRSVMGARQTPATKQLASQECSNMLPANMTSSWASALPKRLLVRMCTKSLISSRLVRVCRSGRNTERMSATTSSGTASGMAARHKEANFRSRCVASSRCSRASASPSATSENARCFAKKMPPMQSTNGLRGCKQSSSYCSFASQSGSETWLAKGSLKAWRPIMPAVLP